MINNTCGVMNPETGHTCRKDWSHVAAQTDHRWWGGGESEEWPAASYEDSLKESDMKPHVNVLITTLDGEVNSVYYDGEEVTLSYSIVNANDPAVEFVDSIADPDD